MKAQRKEHAGLDGALSSQNWWVAALRWQRAGLERPFHPNHSVASSVTLAVCLPWHIFYGSITSDSRQDLQLKKEYLMELISAAVEFSSECLRSSSNGWPCSCTARPT